MKIKLKKILDNTKFKEYNENTKGLEELLNINFFEKDNDRKTLIEGEEVTIIKDFFEAVPTGKLTSNGVVKVEESDWNTSDTIKVAIILESPHKDEYKEVQTTKMDPKFPAQGKTGINLKKNIEEISNISKNILQVNKDIKIFIINPVPYQTSLHAITKESSLRKSLRDFVWKEIWKDTRFSCKTNLETEIKDKNISIIFNCCTKDLKMHIEEFIKDKVNECNYLEFSHPSKDIFDFEVKNFEKLISMKLFSQRNLKINF